jgi:hypothetical protein
MPLASSCTNAPIADECATASAALSPLLSSFSKYNIQTAPEQAALLSWIAYESAELKYNANHFPAPGRPGQGTRNMMMPNYVAEYASSIPELSAQVSAAGGDPAKILQLVQGDEYSFGSAAWFYANKCGEGVKEGVKSGGRAGWEGFITGCVVTSLDDGRVEYWERASRALGIAV